MQNARRANWKTPHAHCLLVRAHIYHVVSEALWDSQDFVFKRIIDLFTAIFTQKLGLVFTVQTNIQIMTSDKYIIQD